MDMARFNPLVETMQPPPIPAVQAWARSYDGRLGTLIDLSQAVPGYPPHPDLLRWLGEAASSPDFAGYGAIEGDASLRSVYAAHVSALYAAPIGAEAVHLTAGCNQAFAAAVMSVAGPGDTVAMTNPCYFNHETTVAMMGVKTGFVECDAGNGFVPRAADIDAVLSNGAKALALVSPNNPTGAIYPAYLLAEILEICRARGVWLILDETYRDFLAPGSGRPHGLFDMPGWQENLIELYSFSKSYCIPGHRLGAIVAGEAVVEQIAKVMDNLQICAPRAPQQAVAKAIPALVDWREENRTEIGRRADAMRTAFATLPEWDLEAIGAYFAFVRHPFDSLSSGAVSERLARHCGLVTVPGSYFGRGLEGYLRVAFANVSAERIADVPERLNAACG